MRAPLARALLFRIAGAALLAALVSAPAQAKKVSIEWSPIPGATQYEIEIRRDDRVVARKKLEDSSWSGDLKFGVYDYQIRAYDRIKRAGKWTDLMPLVVMPAPPEQESPSDGKKLVLYDSGATIVLTWKPIAGASAYRVEVSRKGGKLKSQLVHEAIVRLKGLEPGVYSWRVVAIVKPTGRVPASFEAKQWESKPSEESEFKVERGKLEAPSLRYPVGVQLPPSGLKQRFKWKAVDGAEAYYFELFPGGGRGPAAAPPKPIFETRTTDNVVTVTMPGEGSYRWRVRALANVDDKKVAEAQGPQSTADFKLDKNAAFLEGSGYVALSTMLAPYSYKVVSPATNVSGTAASSALTGRLSGEYWFRPQWGAAVGLDLTSFAIGPSSFIRKDYDLLGKYRFNFGQSRYNWSLSVKAGLEGRDYFEILPAGASLGTFSLTTFGPEIGADLRKAFTDRFSVGIKLSYFRPLTVSGPGVQSLTGDASNRNVSFGAQLLYWLNQSWGVGAGGYFELRSVSYTISSAPVGTSGAEQVYTDGGYFFGSLIFSFGR